MGQPKESHPANPRPHSTNAGQTRRRAWRGVFIYATLAAILALGFASALHADTISGTVKDPSGAVVAGARIEITGGSLTQPIVLTSDKTGKFAAPNLSPGKYSVRYERGL